METVDTDTVGMVDRGHTVVPVDQADHRVLAAAVAEAAALVEQGLVLVLVLEQVALLDLVDHRVMVCL